jgi:hypothetical protein
VARERRFEARAIHAGRERDAATGATIDLAQALEAAARAE